MCSIFFNFLTPGATAGEKTYYFDNVSFGTPLALSSFDQSKFSLYPNPTKNILNLTSASVIENVTIYNTLGQLVLKQDFSTNEVSISLQHLNKGVYIVTAKVGNELLRKQFIKN
jgi:hypothetical protein